MIDVKCTSSDTELSINDYIMSLDSRHEMTRLDLSFKLVQKTISGDEL